MSGFTERLAAVRERIAAACAAAGRAPESVVLLPVSKGHAAPAVRAALAAGAASFGENRVQELAAKAAALRDTPARWHLVGSLQTNKVNALLRVEGLELVHSLDREELALALQDRLARAGRALDVLLQVEATGEPEKHGVRAPDAAALLDVVRARCPAVQVQGLMAMGPLHGDAHACFAEVAALRESLRSASGLPLPILSMGMSDDLEAAIARGATLVRVGTALFGPRA